MAMSAKKFLFIRHGMTQGNIERRYLGDPEEPLCEKGIIKARELMKSGKIPRIDTLLSGPALRCRQTAELLFPNALYTICQMQEVNFGIFKSKNADDLLGNKEYGKWLKSSCMGDIPGGDSVADFKKRCCGSFMDIAKISGNGTTALMIHGGNIMSILEKLALPGQDFYKYHIPNCGFFLCRYEEGRLIIERRHP